MKITPKIWMGVGVCVTLAGAAMHTAPAVAADAPAVEGDFHGDFDSAAHELLGGEGGEMGLGLSTMWPRVSLPALSSTQIKKLITGNTLRSNEELALHFAADNTLEGWDDDWSPMPDNSKCTPTPPRPSDYFPEDGKCLKKEIVPVTGTWAVSNNQLCATLKWPGGTRDVCWYMAVMLDRVALFDVGNNGRMEKGGNAVRPGKVLDQIAK